MKKFVLFIYLLPLILIAEEKTLLQDLISSAASNNPLSQKTKSINESRKIESHDAASNWYPKLSLEAQATYQSSVFELPISIPNMTIPEVSLFQYKTSFNINQMIYDGRTINNAKDFSSAKAELTKKSNQVQMAEIERQVAELYFAALTIMEKSKILENYKIRLEADEAKVQTLMDNGVVTKANLNMIIIEKNKITNEIYSTSQDLQSIINSLEILSGQKIDINQITIENGRINQTNNNRPEYELFAAKQELNDLQIKKSRTETLPKIFAFAQVGAGSPNPLNMFEDTFEPYYLVGVKFQWNIFDWGKTSRTSKIAQYQNNIINDDKLAFEQNLEIINNKHNFNIKKYLNLYDYYSENIKLQEEISTEKSLQIEEGTAIISDYIAEISKLNDYKFNKELNKILAQKEQIQQILNNGNYNLNQENK